MSERHLRLLVLMSVFGWAGSTAEAAAPLWHHEFHAAYDEAVRLRRPLLIHFYGQQCPPCRRMEQEVLNQPDVLRILQSSYVAVKIDAGDPSNAQAGQLVQRFGVHALPSDVIIDPLSGRLISQTKGFQDAAQYRTVAVRSRSRFDEANAVMVKDDGDNLPGNPDGPQLELQEDITLGDPQSLIGMDGFSPVSLGAERKWVKGDVRFAFEFKGITYHLASDRELEAFRKNPEDFAPRLLGCDPVTLLESDRAIPGKTDFGAFFDGDLYFFENEESRRRFKADPRRYTRIQHVLRADDLLRVAQQPSSSTAVK